MNTSTNLTCHFSTESVSKASHYSHRLLLIKLLITCIASSPILLLSQAALSYLNVTSFQASLPLHILLLLPYASNQVKGGLKYHH